MEIHDIVVLDGGSEGPAVDSSGADGLGHVQVLRDRHARQTSLLLELFNEEARLLHQAQQRRQEGCPVCDYRAMGHSERSQLEEAQRFLRAAHTTLIREDKRYFDQYGRLPNEANYWGQVYYDPQRFQRALLTQAHEVEGIELQRACAPEGQGDSVRDELEFDSFVALKARHAMQWRMLDAALEVQQASRVLPLAV